MQDPLFARPLDSKRKNHEKVLGVWLFPASAPLKQITQQEEKWSNELSPKRKAEYKLSRGYARFAISNIFKVNPLSIPLFSPPGKAPKLAEGWGHMSLSHCNNAILIGWSPYPIGVDIERSKRVINSTSLGKRIFGINEEKILAEAKGKKLNNIILSKWVEKEAAIKWQKGNIFKDIKKWENLFNSNQYTHQITRQIVCVESIDYKDWKIAIAYNKKGHKSIPIICSKYTN